MKTRLLYLLFAFFMMMPAASYGQFGGVVRRAVNRQVNKEVDSLLDKKVQEKQDEERAKKAAEEQQKQKEQPAVEQKEAVAKDDQGGGNNSNSQSNAGNGAFTGLFGNKVTLKYKDEYDFTSRIYMVTETHDKDDVMKMDFFMFYSANSPAIGVETQTITDKENQAEVTARMVMDGENKIFLMLTELNGSKMGMISEVPEENTQITGPDGKPVKNYKPPVVTKTGNTRVVAGYKCDEYTYKSEDKTSGKIWFTKDANLKIDRRGWNNSGMSYYYGTNAFNDGIILATESYDAKGKLETKTETKEINENFPHKITVTGYTLRQMNMNKK
ncbi:MAG TPA: DUF4412 domain-containing protein [Bacteroidales bacterium]|nr:DUF4412 domain-containing protein [Bacteroidales bacterium]